MAQMVEAVSSSETSGNFTEVTKRGSSNESPVAVTSANDLSECKTGWRRDLAGRGVSSISLKKKLAGESPDKCTLVLSILFTMIRI
jgi:predicted secreted protein